MKKIAITFVPEVDLIRGAEIISRGCKLDLFIQDVDNGRTSKQRYRIAIFSREKGDVEFMYETFGGYMNRTERNGKVLYWWNLQSGALPRMAERMMPYFTKYQEHFAAMVDLYRVGKRRMKIEKADFAVSRGDIMERFWEAQRSKRA